MTPTDTALGEGHARSLDAADPLGHVRERFRLPTSADGRPKTYLAGQSLGAQPVAVRAEVEAELDVWARHGVDGWWARDQGWMEADEAIRASTARLVGAHPGEVATLNALTVNLHALLTTFFRPAGERTTILIDAPTFPSDRYAVESHLRLHGLDPARDLVVVRPRDGESVLRTENLEAAIHEHRERLAVALLAGVNYATGQAHDIPRLTAAVHSADAIALWDLAHAVGNIPLALHDADVDGAAWCTYKYLNAGPGAVGQLFVNERHAAGASTVRLAGWWGNDPETRFRMAETLEPAPGADGWRISTPPILSMAPLRASLAIFDEVGIDALRAKSVRLTGYLERLLDALVPDAEILTPRDPAARGAQLSLRVADGPRVLAALEAADVVVDFREPDIIRVAPVALYNTFHDAWHVAQVLAETGLA